MRTYGKEARLWLEVKCSVRHEFRQLRALFMFVAIDRKSSTHGQDKNGAPI